MKLPCLIILLPLFLLSGCDYRKQEEELNRRSAELLQKEQQLALLERQLQLKEAELQRREQLLDSTRKSSDSTDTLNVFHQPLTGSWQANMRCTETTCEGSAVGDVKNELWTVSYEQQTYIARAMADNRLVRVYTGRYNGESLELTAATDQSDASAAMTVKLHFKNQNELEGQREITRPDCRIVYALSLKRQ